jgi:hypothetical protein
MAGSPVVIAASAKHTATVREFLSSSFTLRIDQCIDISSVIMCVLSLYLKIFGTI